MYKVIISEPAKKFILQLQKKNAARIFYAIEKLADHPRPNGQRNSLAVIFIGLE